MASYRQAVAEARKLVKRSEADQWRLCELTSEQIQAGKSQRQWAKDIGMSREIVSRWIRMWDQWGGHAGPLPSYSEAMRQDTPSAYGAERIERGVANLPPEKQAALAAKLIKDHPPTPAQVVDAMRSAPEKYARAIARHDDTRAAVEDAGIVHRGRHAPDDVPDAKQAGSRAADRMAGKLNTDLATRALRDAAGSIAEAILCKEEYGVRNKVEEAEALARLDHLRAAYSSGSPMSDDDRGWLDSIGVEL